MRGVCGSGANADCDPVFPQPAMHPCFKEKDERLECCCRLVNQRQRRRLCHYRKRINCLTSLMLMVVWFLKQFPPVVVVRFWRRLCSSLLPNQRQSISCFSVAQLMSNQCPLVCLLSFEMIYSFGMRLGSLEKHQKVLLQNGSSLHRGNRRQLALKLLPDLGILTCTIGNIVLYVLD